MIKDDFPIIHIDTLTEEQQKKYLIKYNKVVKLKDKILVENINKLNNINRNIKYLSIKELINQPIFLNLIFFNDIDISIGGNKSAIYDQLFNDLIHKSWDKFSPSFSKNIRIFIEKFNTDNFF
ncbi:MAG: hypothetical protein IPG79_14355 [Saprospiraceae bacterium]|nr:hypothetical protein [Saprospiraceae bacterium]